MEPIERINYLTDRQLYARIQHYYDHMHASTNKEYELTIEKLEAEQELKGLIKDFERLFSDIIYTY